MNKNMKRVAIVGTAAVATMGVGVAFAAWSSSGSGSGTAQSTTSTDSTISAAASAANLYPGAVNSVTVSINNPNPYPVKVLTISAGSSNLVNGCAAGSVTSDAVSSAPATVIAAGASGTYTLVTRMIADPSNACKSQTFTLPLTATLESAAS